MIPNQTLIPKLVGYLALYCVFIFAQSSGSALKSISAAVLFKSRNRKMEKHNCPEIKYSQTTASALKTYTFRNIIQVIRSTSSRWVSFLGDVVSDFRFVVVCPVQCPNHAF